MAQTIATMTFNPPQAAAAARESVAAEQPLHSEAPFVQLEFDAPGERADVARVARQRRGIPSARTLAVHAADPFGPELDWAYRCYKVHAPSPGGDRPSGAPPGGDSVFQEYLYLFNVLVALEWQPDEPYLQALEWAFRRASDLLFDATNGWMAFGQVVFGGPEFLDSADIQIMASNRLLPRSWVGGLHSDVRYPDDEKYMPIRLGRGLWSDRRRDAIAWEEPEGYRTIVHEWGHYALKLRDAYLETRQLALAGQALPGADGTLFRPALRTVVMPRVGIISESIMAAPEGASELLQQQRDDVAALYPRMRADTGPHVGPRQLPLPLPRFRRQEGLDGSPEALFFPARSAAPALYGRLPDATRLEHCWLYLLKGAGDGQLIAQGTLEARTADTPFRLLGAAPGDTVVLVAETRDRQPLVLSATLDAAGQLAELADATPAAIPTIDVLPGPADARGRMASVALRLSGAADPPAQAALFPLGAAAVPVAPAAGQPGWLSQFTAVKTLDGHVLLRWPGGKYLISPFSQGGGPQTHTPSPANPITAGSSDGGAMLFFKNDGPPNEAYGQVKVVTTLARGLAGAPGGGRERGYAFGIASNAALPAELSPTLVLYTDPLFLLDDEREAMTGALRICRWQAGAWVALPTYIPPGYPFVVIPLDGASAGALLDPTAADVRVEYYKACWIPAETP